MAAQVAFFVAPVVAGALPTSETHPHTHAIKFNVSHDAAGLVNVEGFRNLLEAHIGTLHTAKQTSYTRNEEWIHAIRDKRSNAPKNYAGNQASWKNEIGYTRIETSKWVVEGGKVYRKNAHGRESQPETPTEDLYDTLTKVHAKHGHKGRDGFFTEVQKVSGSIKKALCHQFVQVCCDRAMSWDNGNVAHGWQAPVTRRMAVQAVNNIAVDNNINAAARVELHAAPAREIRQDDQQPGLVAPPNSPWQAPQQLGNYGYNNSYGFDPNFAGQIATPAYPPVGGRQSQGLADNSGFLNMGRDPMLYDGMDNSETEAPVASNIGPDVTPVDPDLMLVDMPFDLQSQLTWGFIPYDANPF